MKYLMIGLLLSFQAGATSRALCAKIVKEAQDRSVELGNRFNAGEVTRTDVAQAKLKVLNAQLHCYLILVDAYCSQATDLATIALAGMNDEARVGQRTSQDVDAAAKALNDVREVCE